MKKDGKLISRAVLATVLSLSLGQVAWAAEGIEGVDKAFETVDALEQAITAAGGGTVTIDANNVAKDIKGIYASGHNFEYQLGPVALEVKGFTENGSPNQGNKGILAYERYTCAV